MTTQLSWTASPSAACWQAAEHWGAGRMPAAATMHEALTAGFAAPALALDAFLREQNIPAAPFFEQLTPAACEIESNRALAHTALTKSVGRARADVLAERMAGLLTDCEAAYFAAFPKLREELELRFRPLRELWDARGPGLVAGVGRRTDKRLVPEAARVAAVPPYLGGGGWAAAPSNTVVFEMVLANPIDQLPETLRLGWLVTLLNFDLPDFAEALPPIWSWHGPTQPDSYSRPPPRHGCRRRYGAAKSTCRRSVWRPSPAGGRRHSGATRRGA